MKEGVALDVSGGRDNGHNDGGETGCLDLLLAEAAFDVLGAARFIRNDNPGFARQSIESALAELKIVATRLGGLA